MECSYSHSTTCLQHSGSSKPFMADVPEAHRGAATMYKSPVYTVLMLMISGAMTTVDGYDEICDEHLLHMVKDVNHV